MEIYVAQYDSGMGVEMIGAYSTLYLAKEALSVVWAATAAESSGARTIEQWGWQSNGPVIWTARLYSHFYFIERVTVDAPMTE